MKQGLGVFAVVIMIAAVMIANSNNKSTPTTTQAPPPNEFWPEGTGMSPECTAQVLENRTTPACKANLERWGAQLDKNLNDPEFRRRMNSFGR